MDSLGLNSDMPIGGRTFHIQTSLSAGETEIVTTVFDGGQLIERKSRQIDRDASVSRLKGEVESFHEDVGAGFELLFNMAKKLKSIKHPASHNRLGVLFFNRNLIQEAREQFEVAIAGDADNAEYHLNLGNVYFAMQMIPQAVEQYSVGIRQEPGYADLHRSLALAYGRQGKYAEAAEQLREAVRLNGKYHEAHFDLGMILLESAERGMHDSSLPVLSRRLSEASERLRLAIKLSDDYDTKRVKAALRFIGVGQVREALRELLLARQDGAGESRDDFEEEFFLRLLVGGQESDEGLVEEFAEKLEELIDQHPRYADLRNDLGITYLIKARTCLIKAKEEFEEAVRINPDFEKARKNLRLVENDGRGFLILLRALLK